MKRLPLFGFVTLALGIVALAAETIRYEPALNTITKYRITSQSTAEILSSSLTTSDGLPAPEAFKNILASLKSALNTTQIQEMTEKVVGIDADGTRQLETTIVAKSTPPIGYEIRSSQTPNGLLIISSFKFDAATLAQPGFAALGDSFANTLRDNYAQAQPSIYGKPLELGQTLTFAVPNVAEVFTSAFKAIPDAKIQIQGLQGNLSYNYQGRNGSNDYTFKTSGNTALGKFTVEFAGFSLEQSLSESRSEGEAIFSSDGRAKTSRQSGSLVLTQIQKINLNPQVLTLTFSARTTTVSSTEVLP